MSELIFFCDRPWENFVVVISFVVSQLQSHLLTALYFSPSTCAFTNYLGGTLSAGCLDSQTAQTT